MTLPDNLRHPIKTKHDGMLWVQRLCRAGLMFHFEDSPETILKAGSYARLFDDLEAAIVRDRIAELYALDWGDSCPIGYALSIMHE